MGESDRAAEHRQLSELLAPLGLCICEIPVRFLGAAPPWSRVWHSHAGWMLAQQLLLGCEGT